MASDLLEERAAGAAGRGLFVKSAVDAGRLLLRNKPYRALGLTLCKEAVELLRCSRCKFARYCSQTCQRSAWLEHKEECSDILRISPRHPTDTVLLTARLLRKRKENPQGYAEVTHLNTYRDFYSKDQLETFFQLGTLILDFVDEKYRTSIDEIVDILCKFKTNNFSISDPEMRAVGAGLYPYASLINHSCSPTAVAVFTGREVSVRAIRSLPAGTEVTLSYIEVATPTSVRRRELKTTWFFECACELCSMTTPAALNRDALLTAVHTPCTHGSASPSECVECVKLRARATALLAEGQTAEKKDLKKLSEALKIAQQLGPGTSWLALEAAQAVQSAAIDHADWMVATRVCAVVAHAFEAVYAPQWPLTGLQYAMLAKLEKLLGAPESEAHFVRALAVLRVTHGAEHPLLATLRQLLDEVASERAFSTAAVPALAP